MDDRESLVEKAMYDNRESLVEKATRAADPSIQYSSGNEEVCNICEFRFDDPIKKTKTIGNCPVCYSKVHKPCIRKTPCRNCD